MMFAAESEGEREKGKRFYPYFYIRRFSTFHWETGKTIFCVSVVIILRVDWATGP